MSRIAAYRHRNTHLVDRDDCPVILEVVVDLGCKEKISVSDLPSYHKLKRKREREPTTSVKLNTVVHYVQAPQGTHGEACPS
jgi:hypothetical protein